MKQFLNNDTIKALLHVPPHIEFTTNDPVVFHFLKVILCRTTLISGRHYALYRTFIPTTSLQLESNAISRVSFIFSH
jgi:hypothetical protein